MNAPSHWAGVRVRDFFGGYNWSGETVRLEPTVTETFANSSSALCLQVKDFLAQANWRGIALAPVVASPTATPAPALLLPLTATVADYFRGVPWGGGAFLPSAPAPKPRPQPEASQDDLDLTDLSGLF
ncbi:MAG: hypothetical protein ACK5CA_11120 [Cyanobacteriota bacterium]|jgi:hypothetical protein